MFSLFSVAVCLRVKLLLDGFEGGGGGVNECFSPPSCHERSLEFPAISQCVDKNLLITGDAISSLEGGKDCDPPLGASRYVYNRAGL